MKNLQTSECKHCGVIYNPREIKRIYGKLSRPYLLGYCSAQCYTQDVIIKSNTDENKKDTV